MSGATVPPAKPPVPGHDDGLRDAVALMEAANRDDLLAVTVLGKQPGQATPGTVRASTGSAAGRERQSPGQPR